MCNTLIMRLLYVTLGLLKTIRVEFGLDYFIFYWDYYRLMGGTEYMCYKPYFLM